MARQSKEVAAHFIVTGKTATYNPIASNVNAFSKYYTQQAGEIVSRVKWQMERGRTLEDAIRYVLTDPEIDQALSEKMVDTMVNTAKAGAGARAAKTVGLKRWFLENIQSPGGNQVRAQLSDIIDTSTITHKAQAVRQMAASTRRAEAQAIAAIRNGQYSPAAFNNLERSLKASLAIGNAGTEMRQARASLRRIKAELERQAIKPGARIEGVINRIESLVSGTMGKAEVAALKDAVYRDCRFQAERIMRTEAANAYTLAYHTESLADEDVVGWRSVLSSAHTDIDICDWWATADLYGMGPGIYPKTNGPDIPYHPNCMCLMEEVFVGEVPEGRPSIDDESAIRQIDRLSAEEKQALMGKGGAARYKDDPGSWRDVMKNYSEPTEKKAAIPLSLLHGE